MARLIRLSLLLGFTACNLFIDSSLIKRFAQEEQGQPLEKLKCTGVDGPHCFQKFSSENSKQQFENLKTKNQEVRNKSAQNSVGQSEGIKLLEGSSAVFTLSFYSYDELTNTDNLTVTETTA